MDLIKKDEFERAYRKLLYVTNTKFPGTDVSFRTGFWEYEEGYKRYVWEDARAAMELDSWQRHRNDPFWIVQKANEALGVATRGDDTKQNLVSQPNSASYIMVAVDNLPKTAAILYNLFFGTDDHTTFDDFSKLITSRKKGRISDPISVISYFFFLKDKDRYAPARKKGTMERLNRLGYRKDILKPCTWEDYSTYLSIIEQLRSFLLPYHPETTLLDAQSFLWMLWHVDSSTPEFQGSPK